jgi:diguanylate cyclase (GGDEF)-like protein
VAIDGDNLKAYNEYGYQRGNEMIRDLGELLTAVVRPVDRVARWLSGDEYLVLLPGADLTIARNVGERLRAAVENGTRRWLPVTVSVGAASCPRDATTAAELLATVEERGLASKRAGKNKVS